MSLQRIMTAVAALGLLASSTSAQYVQLVDLPTLLDGGTGTLAGGTIDGTTGFAAIGGATSRIVRIDDLGGANTVTTLVDTDTLNATFSDGSIGGGIAGQLFVDGDSLFFLSPGEDEILEIDTTSGAASVLVSETGLDGFIGGTGPTVFFGGVNPTSGNVLFYEGDTDTVIEVTGPDTFTTFLTDTELASISGDDTPAGLAFNDAGVLFLGQTTDPENVSFFDPADDSSGTLVTEADVLAALGTGDDIGGSTTAFAIVNGDLVFFESTQDSFIAFDPADPVASLEVVITEAALLSGPANSDFASAFATFGDQIAWVQTISAGGQVPGFFAIPEPTSIALLMLGGVALPAWRRR